MYQRIYVPVDNSDHSNRAVAWSLALGKAYRRSWSAATSTRQNCTTIAFGKSSAHPAEEYIDEVELERQRKIHDSLITMGLKLISDSYLDGMSKQCVQSGLEFEARMMDGKHHIEILKDLAARSTIWS